MLREQAVQSVQAATLCFKSWLPDCAQGSKPVVIAGRDTGTALATQTSKPARVLCIGPNEWLIVSREAGETNLPDRIAVDLAEYGLVAADVSNELAAIELRGSLAREVLEKGSDLHMAFQRFMVGQCVRTRLASVDVVVDYVDGTPCFELYFSRSHFACLHAWLINIADELESSLPSLRC